MKAIIFDSGVLINMSLNGFFHILEPLRKISECKFLITKQVKYEIVDRPLKIPRFELGALRIRDLIDRKVIEMPDILGIGDKEIVSKMDYFMNKANHLVQVNGRWIEIVSEGEMSCLALSSILFEKSIDNLIGVDERTTRILAENPREIEKVISNKIHQNTKMIKSDLSDFYKFKFIRTSEILYSAFKLGLINIKDPKALEACLYASKFSGASISFEEIDILKKL